jgi:hypothetical protein
MPQGMADVRLDGRTFDQRCALDRLQPLAKSNPARRNPRPDRLARRPRRARRNSGEEVDSEGVAEAAAAAAAAEAESDMRARQQARAARTARAEAEAERVAGQQLEKKAAHRMASFDLDTVRREGARVHVRQDRPRVAVDSTGQLAYTGNPIDGAAYYLIVDESTKDDWSWVKTQDVFNAAQETRTLPENAVLYGGGRSVAVQSSKSLPSILGELGFYELDRRLQALAEILVDGKSVDADQMIPSDDTRTGALRMVKAGSTIEVRVPTLAVADALQVFFFEKYPEIVERDGIRFESKALEPRKTMRLRSKMGQSEDEVPVGLKPGRPRLREPQAGLAFATIGQRGEVIHHIAHRRVSPNVERLRELFSPYAFRQFRVEGALRATPDEILEHGALTLWLSQLSKGEISREVAADLIVSGAVAIDRKTLIEFDPSFSPSRGSTLRVWLPTKNSSPFFSWVPAILPVGREEESMLSSNDRRVVDRLGMAGQVLYRVQKGLRSAKYLMDRMDDQETRPRPGASAHTTLVVLAPPTGPGDAVQIGKLQVEIPIASSREAVASALAKRIRRGARKFQVPVTAEAEGAAVRIQASLPGSVHNGFPVRLTGAAGGGRYKPPTRLMGGIDTVASREARALASGLLSFGRWKNRFDADMKSGDPIAVVLADKYLSAGLDLENADFSLSRAYDEIVRLLHAGGLSAATGLRGESTSDTDALTGTFIEAVESSAPPALKPLFQWLAKLPGEEPEEGEDDTQAAPDLAQLGQSAELLNPLVGVARHLLESRQVREELSKKLAGAMMASTTHGPWIWRKLANPYLDWVEHEHPPVTEAMRYAALVQNAVEAAQLPREQKRAYSIACKIINEVIPHLVANLGWSMDAACSYGRELMIVGLLFVRVGGEELVGDLFVGETKIKRTDAGLSVRDAVTELKGKLPEAKDMAEYREQQRALYDRTRSVMQFRREQSARARELQESSETGQREGVLPALIDSIKDEQTQMLGGARGIGASAKLRTYLTYNPVLFDVTRRFFSTRENEAPFHGILAYRPLTQAVDLMGVYGHAVALTQRYAAEAASVEDVMGAILKVVGSHIKESIDGQNAMWAPRVVMTGWAGKKAKIEFPFGHFDHFRLNWVLGASYQQADADLAMWVDNPLGYIASLKESIEVLVPTVWRIGHQGLPSNFVLSSGDGGDVILQVMHGQRDPITTEEETPARTTLRRALALAVPSTGEPEAPVPGARLAVPPARERQILTQFQARTGSRPSGVYDRDTLHRLQDRLARGVAPGAPLGFFASDQDAQRSGGKETKRRGDLPESSLVLRAEQQLSSVSLVERINRTMKALKEKG